jgi:hypothetical protein
MIFSFFGVLSNFSRTIGYYSWRASRRFANTRQCIFLQKQNRPAGDVVTATAISSTCASTARSVVDDRLDTDTPRQSVRQRTVAKIKFYKTCKTICSVKPMIIGEVEFRFICNLDPEKGVDGIFAELMPQTRYKNTRGLPHQAHRDGPFCRLRIPSTHRTYGVYALVVNDITKYVGECVNLSSRYNTG